MGFFGSRNKPSELPKVIRPVVVQPADVPGFSLRLEAVERAIGGPDAPLRGAIQALSASVGGMDGMEIIKRGLDREEIKRPWRWFAQACEVANAQGDYELAPRVLIFTGWWKSLLGKLTMADYMDMWLDPVPPDVDQAISNATAEAIAHLPDDHRIGPAASEVITVGQVRSALQAPSAT